MDDGAKRPRIARRNILQVGLAGLAALAPIRASRADPAASGSIKLVEPGSDHLGDLARKLAAAPRRRDFTNVPMILTSRETWDAEAIDLVKSSFAEPRQVWNNTDIGGYWLTVMRNALNTQIWGFRHPDFLVVSATHGSAGFALYDQATWDKYAIAKLFGDKFGERFKTNRMIVEPDITAEDVAHFEDPDGLFSSAKDSIPLLQRRGAVFMACHNAIWEHAAGLIRRGQNPDKLDQGALAAELTNHLVPGVVLTPGIVGTLPELQRAGFSYASI